MKINLPKPQDLRKYFVTGSTKEILRWMSFSLVIGVVAGIGALLFSDILGFTNSFFLGKLAHYHPPLPGSERVAGEIVSYTPPFFNRFLFLLIPTFGGLLSGILVYTFAPEAEGHGTDAVIDAFHNKRGRIRPIVPFIKIVASALTIGSGGSAGREGPIAQIGASFGSFLGKQLKLSVSEIRQLVIIGAGAGIGAIFRAPLGGAIFAATVLYRETDYEHGILMPGFIASIVAYALYVNLGGTAYGPIFTIKSTLGYSLSQLPFYLALGMLTVPLCMGYVYIFYAARDKFFQRLPLPSHLRPAVGGLMVGGIALFFPAVLGMGYGWLQDALDGKLTIAFLLALSLLKIFATSFTISSGGSGGVFAPSLVIGGAFGGVVGGVLHQLYPELVPDAGAFVLVGMAAFFAAAAKVPIASLIMVSEMTGGYQLLVPSMLAIAAGYMLMPKRLTIYEKQVANRFASPAHRGDYVVDVLEDIQVKDVVSETPPPRTVSAETHISEILSLYTQTQQSVFPIVSSDGKFMGFVPIDLLRSLPLEQETSLLIIAYDLMERAPVLSPSDDLHNALEKLIISGMTELPVVSEDGKLVGLLSRRELLRAYYQRMKSLRSGT